MKKKIIFAIATGLFALATVFNMNVLQSNSAGDVSLEGIAVMAQAQAEMGTNCTNCKVFWVYCPDGTRVIRCRLDGDGCFAEWQELC